MCITKQILHLIYLQQSNQPYTCMASSHVLLILLHNVCVSLPNHNESNVSSHRFKQPSSQHVPTCKPCLQTWVPINWKQAQFTFNKSTTSKPSSLHSCMLTCPPKSKIALDMYIWCCSNILLRQSLKSLSMTVASYKLNRITDFTLAALKRPSYRCLSFLVATFGKLRTQFALEGFFSISIQTPQNFVHISKIQCVNK